jgi:hypothetical protein
VSQPSGSCLCCTIHERGNCAAEISKHQITACITTTVTQHQTICMSLVPQYVPSCKGQTVPEVNCKRVSFLFLFHSIMRANQIEALEVQNETKNLRCAAVGTESTYCLWNIWQYDEHQQINKCFRFLSDPPVYTLNTEKWNTFYGHCITRNCTHLQYQSANQPTNLPHIVPVCPHYTLNPFSEYSYLLQTSQDASFITYYIHNYCTYILICTNINTVIITTVTEHL